MITPYFYTVLEKSLRKTFCKRFVSFNVEHFFNNLCPYPATTGEVRNTLVDVDLKRGHKSQIKIFARFAYASVLAHDYEKHGHINFNGGFDASS